MLESSGNKVVDLSLHFPILSHIHTPFLSLSLTFSSFFQHYQNPLSLSMDTNQWPQAIGLVKPIIQHQESSSPPKENSINGGDQIGKPRPQKGQALNCPRCNSTNTKFCYYNNYSLTQPRYFCKTCRRYWTEGGTLRNVPVGGGSRKNKRSSISSVQVQKIKNPNSDLSQIPSFPQNPSKIHDTHDLNLAYQDDSTTTSTTSTGSLLGLNYLPYPINNIGNPSLSGISPKSLSSLMALPNIYSPSLLPMQQDYKPKVNNFCLDGFDDGSAKLFLPNYEDLKPLSMAEQFEQRQLEQGGGGGGQGGGGSGGGEYWSGGMIGGGSW